MTFMYLEIAKEYVGLIDCSSEEKKMRKIYVELETMYMLK